jgi:hypothetical protein
MIGNQGIPFLPIRERRLNMENEKIYFKQPTPGEFVKAALPLVSLFLIFYFTFIPIFAFLLWAVRSGPFVIFPRCRDLAFYCVFVTFFVTREYKRYQSLYFRMQEVPFLTMTKEGIRMDRAMVMFPKGFEWAGKIELEWTDIQRVEIGQDSFVIYFKENGKEKSERVNLKWVEEKEELLAILAGECNNITLKKSQTKKGSRWL